MLFNFTFKCVIAVGNKKSSVRVIGTVFAIAVKFLIQIAVNLFFFAVVRLQAIMSTVYPRK